jgi:hypothetical protein
MVGGREKKMLEWLQNMDRSEVAMIGFCVLLVVVLGVLVADMSITEPFIVQGRVIGAEYTPASSGVGTGVSSGGGPFIVTTHGSEKWTLVISVNGRVETFEVSPDMFYSVKVGEQVEMSCRKGKIIGIVSCTAARPRVQRTGFQPYAQLASLAQSSSHATLSAVSHQFTPTSRQRK